MNMSKHTWLFWTILIVGLWLVGACSSGNPTIPDPSDVQDFTYEEGDGWEQEELSDLIDSYESLVDLGGGVATVVDPNNYTLLGAFHRWSTDPVSDVQLIVEQAGEDPVGIDFSDKILFSDLVYPITLTVYHDYYVTQTVVETNANVIAFGLERRVGYSEPAMIVGYSFNYTQDDAPWLCLATSSHLNWPWETTTGFLYADPSTLVIGNAYQPVGAIAFLYEGDTPSEGSQLSTGNLSTNPEDYTIAGISYSHIGTLDPGSVGGWILNLDQEGTGNSYTAGNYTLNYTVPPDGTATVSYATLTVTPGGWQNDSFEFIPYYPPKDVSVFADAGTYDLNAYDPPLVPDRHVVLVEITYSDGGCETRMVDWDPSGAGAPNLTFGDLPVCTGAVFSFDPDPRLNVTWSGDPVVGMQVLNVTDQWGNVIWRIFVAGDASQLPVDGILVPPYVEDSGSGTLKLSSLGDADIAVTGVACAGITPDGFDTTTITNNTTTQTTSVQAKVVPQPVL